MNLHIVQLERSLPDGVVFTAHWIASLTEDEHIASTYGSVELEQKDPSDPDFIPFDDLTEEVVIGWVQAKIGDEIEATLNRHMQALKNPTSASGVPWSEPEPEITEGPVQLELNFDEEPQVS
jgi:hypothetical protein